MPRRLVVLLFAGVFISAILIGTNALAVSFSIERLSLTPLAPDDIINPGPLVLYAEGALADTDALSYGRPLGQAELSQGGYFSVDRGALGVAGTAVSVEAGGIVNNDQSADIYVSALNGQNGHVFDGDGLLPPGVGGPPLGLLEPGSGVNLPPWSTDLDALDMRMAAAPNGVFFYSVDAASAANFFGSGADVIFAPPVPGLSPGYHSANGLYAAAPQLGLVAADDIDSLIVFENGMPGYQRQQDILAFSLAPNSPYLGTLDPWGSGLPINEGDILIDPAIAGTATPAIVVPAEALGLLTVRSGANQNDNLNALDIPEPGTAVLLGLGGLCLIGYAWRRRKPAA